jgi:hypothetical protein
VHSTVSAACCSPLNTRLATVVVAAFTTPAIPHPHVRAVCQKPHKSGEEPPSLGMWPRVDAMAAARAG